MDVSQSAEYMLGKCPVCGKLRTNVANGVTDCGHNAHAGAQRASQSPKDMERYIHAKTAEEQIHFGRKLRMKGYENL